MLQLSSCKSSETVEPAETIDLYFPIFPSPIRQDGTPYCEYYPKDPQKDQVTKQHLNEIGGYYNPDNDRINIPYDELRDCVIVPYDYWLQVLNYSAETEAAVRSYEAGKKK